MNIFFNHTSYTLSIVDSIFYAHILPVPAEKKLLKVKYQIEFIFVFPK